MFPANTLVLLSTGKYLPIAEIKPGDVVISHLGKPRSVLELITEKREGKVYRIDVGSQAYLVGLEDNRYLFEKKGEILYKKISQSTNRDYLRGYIRPDMKVFKNGFDELAFAKHSEIRKLVSLQATTSKLSDFYSLVVEEEHSYLVSGYSGSFLYGCRSR